MLAAGGLGACGGGDDGAAPTTSAEVVEVVPSTTVTTGPLLDNGTFCTSIQGIQALSAGPQVEGAATVEQVLAQNEQLLDLLDEASASVPEGSPFDVEALFDDYRVVAQGIGAAGGDVEAAYAALQTSSPEVMARLVNPSAHLPAFEFFTTHCGIKFG
jgi:hypothetical protein